MEVKCVTIERPHGHKFRHRTVPDNGRLLLIKQGSVTVSSADKTVTAIQGEFIIIQAGVDVTTEYTADKNCVVMLLFKDVPDEFGEDIMAYPHNTEAELLMESAIGDCTHSPFKLKAILYGVMNYLTLGVNSCAAGDVNAVIDYINEHYSDNLPVSKYAAMACVSESHFRKRFVAVTGMSPIEYRNAIRLRVARELISAGYTVAEAAETVGFNSTSFYCRLASRENHKATSPLAT